VERDYTSEATANSTSQLCLSNFLHFETSTLLRELMTKVGRMIKRKIGPRRKQGLPRYLSCLLYNDIHLNTFYLVAGRLLLKPGSTETRTRKREEKKRILNFFGGYIPKITENQPFFGRYHAKPENWHFGDY
jgi:hypothetical protein